MPVNSCNSDVGDNVGLVRLAVPLCSPDTGVCKPPTTLSPPSVLLSLWVQHERGASVSVAPGQCLYTSCSLPSQPSEPALMGFQPCCSTAHNTSSYWGAHTASLWQEERDSWSDVTVCTAWPRSRLVASWFWSFTFYTLHQDSVGKPVLGLKLFFLLEYIYWYFLS